jgi:glyoxylase-like metal-dependent hydrolase (beta-lactamase superfamily II)
LVDVGDFEKVLYQLPKKAKIQGVFLTHTHFDHIYGINEMNKVFPNCRVFVSKYGEEALFSAKKNFSYYYESPIIYGGQNIQVLCEGDSVELYPSVNMKVYETPGHCPSCLSYEVDNNFFSGDSFICHLYGCDDVLPEEKCPYRRCYTCRVSHYRGVRDHAIV